MKTVSGPLAAHLQQETTSLCTCWKISRKDGEVLRFTDHDVDLVVDGETYIARTSYKRTAVQNSAGGSVDNLEVQLIFDPDSLTTQDIQAGRYDAATVEIFAVNWRAPSDGTIAIRKGFLGEMTLTRKGVGRAELRGLAQALTKRLVEVYSPDCRADLGDERCKVDLDLYRVAGEVTEVIDRRTFVASLSAIPGSPSPEPTLEDGYYEAGLVSFDSGANDFVRLEVREYIADSAGGTFVLFLPTPFPIEVGATFVVYPGCKKRFLEDCRDKFDNTINFRGEPYVPGTDVLLNTTAPGDTST